MRAGRKNLKRASCEKECLCLQDGESIMQVVSLRGSNLIEVMDAKGVKSLALFPAKFQRSLWMKRGSFVVVDASGREKALGSGSKVACVISQVLFQEQVRVLQKSPSWPEVFRTALMDNSSSQQQAPVPQLQESDADGSDGLPALEANLNRNRPVELYSDTDTDTDLDSDAEDHIESGLFECQDGISK
uniref:Putative RNA-binding protein EIF1AD n=1 Tax=Anthurium amnicola TaxID=1678845 RepID=A0A1D1Y3W7_9ARAE